MAGDDRMKITSAEYGELVKAYSPPSTVGKDTLNAFWIGGLICVLGQLIHNGWMAAGGDHRAHHGLCHLLGGSCHGV